MTDIRMRSARRAACVAAIVSMLAACAGPQVGRGTTAPSGDTAGVPATSPAARRGGYYLDDGPGADSPVDLASIPDAVPQPEPLLPRTMRPYSVFGRPYTPMTQIEPFRERGVASWYGRRYHGQPTSSGERYDMYAMTAAHPTLPIPSYARVTSVANGRSVVVRVNDRGPFLQNRVIDLSYTAAAKLGYVEAGSAEVDVELVTQFDGAATTAASASAGANRAATATAAASTVAPAPMPTGAASPAPPLTLTLAPLPAVDAAPAASGDVTRPSVATISSTPEASRAEALSPSRIDPPAPPRVDVPLPPRAEASLQARADTGAAVGVAAGAASVRSFWLQFGAFNSLANARGAMAQLARRLDFLGAGFDVRQEGAMYKVQAGPWERREEALAAAARVRARTGLRPFTTPR